MIAKCQVAELQDSLETDEQDSESEPIDRELAAEMGW